MLPICKLYLNQVTILINQRPYFVNTKVICLDNKKFKVGGLGLIKHFISNLLKMLTLNE